MYKPHRNSKVIIVIVPGRNELFHADILHGVIDSATAHGFHVVSYRDLPTVANALEFIDMLKTLHVQGIISAVYLDKELLWMLADSFPVVQCCEYSDDKISYVSFDDWTGTKNAIKSICISLGKRKHQPPQHQPAPPLSPGSPGGFHGRDGRREDHRSGKLDRQPDAGGIRDGGLGGRSSC